MSMLLLMSDKEKQLQMQLYDLYLGVYQSAYIVPLTNKLFKVCISFLLQNARILLIHLAGVKKKGDLKLF